MNAATETPRTTGNQLVFDAFVGAPIRGLPAAGVALRHRETKFTMLQAFPTDGRSDADFVIAAVVDFLGNVACPAGLASVVVYVGPQIAPHKGPLPHPYGECEIEVRHAGSDETQGLFAARAAFHDLGVAAQMLNELGRASADALTADELAHVNELLQHASYYTFVSDLICGWTATSHASAGR